ncbi:MAG: carbon monoxide dehydrogenase subunit G [Woeseiaceae bacterium]
MDIKGEYQIASSREQVWAALNDPEMLKACIPGCESMEKVSDTEFSARVMAAIGPVRAKFDTRLTLENVQPPVSYTLVGSSKGGAAGFGRGSADVRLAELDGGTQLTYDADFKVGGKLAQVGSRLVLGVTRKTADDFFGNLSRKLDPHAQRIEPVEKAAVLPKTWLALAAAIIALLIWWFLLR